LEENNMFTTLGPAIPSTGGGGQVYKEYFDKMYYQKHDDSAGNVYYRYADTTVAQLIIRANTSTTDGTLETKGISRASTWANRATATYTAW